MLVQDVDGESGGALKIPDKTGHWTKRLSPWRADDAMLMWGESIQSNRVFSAAGETSENSIYIVCALKTHNRFPDIELMQITDGGDDEKRLLEGGTPNANPVENIHLSKSCWPGLNAWSGRSSWGKAKC